MDLIESLFVSMGEPDPWGSIINPIWAAHLLDVEEAWDRAPEPSTDLTPGETPQRGFASFTLQPSQASLGETDKWIETRSVFEDTAVECFLLEGEDAQAPNKESVKGPHVLTNISSPLPSSLDPIPVPSDERLSEPERDQLATPCSAYEEPEGPERRSTNILKPLPDRVFPHLELFLAQLVGPVRRVMWSFSSRLPS